MYKKLLRIFAGILASTAVITAAENYTAKNLMAYNSLLKQTTRHQRAQIRKLKQLAARMIVRLADNLRNEQSFLLSHAQEIGLENLDDFAKYVLRQLGKTTKDTQAAYRYAMYLFNYAAANPGLALMPKQDALKTYFANFNYTYTPLLDTITILYGQKTRLPHILSLDTLEQWTYQGGKAEPGI